MDFHGDMGIYGNQAFGFRYQVSHQLSAEYPSQKKDKKEYYAGDKAYDGPGSYYSSCSHFPLNPSDIDLFESIRFAFPLLYSS